MPMTQLSYTVRFETPAFLGNAEQAGQWRTPPFKALLRQWWRVVYAADHWYEVDVAAMRREEGLLFGNAWLSHREGLREVADHCKSLIRMRLDVPSGSSEIPWRIGSQKGVAPLPTDISTSHAWFGLIDRGNGLPDRSGIKPATDEKSRILRLAVPEQHAPRVEDAVRLIGHFGQLGSRSRGGWGSISIEGIESLAVPRASLYALPLRDCLKHEWPLALTRDSESLLIWDSRTTFPTWDKAMRAVALERRRVRTELKGIDGQDLRFVLGFAGAGRMPSPLRWKVVVESNGQLAIRMFAMPHAFPTDSGQSWPEAKLIRAWKIVRDALDQSAAFKRIPNP